MSGAGVPLRFAAYVVVDTVTTPSIPLVVCMSRRQCREWMEQNVSDPSAQRMLRVRRAKVTLYES